MNRLEKIVYRASGIATPVEGPEFSSEGCIGIRLWVSVSNLTLGSLTAKLQIKNPTSGLWYDFPGAVFAAIPGPADASLTIYPGLPVLANITINNVISGGLRIHAAVGGGGSGIFTVTAQLLE